MCYCDVKTLCKACIDNQFFFQCKLKFVFNATDTRNERFNHHLLTHSTLVDSVNNSIDRILLISDDGHPIYAT